MKNRLFLILGLGFALIGASFFVASLGMFRAHAVALHSLERISKALREADSIELVSLSSEPNRDSRKIITAESGGVYYTGKTRTLSPADTREFVSLLSDHMFTTETRAGCHDPGELVIFRSDGLDLLEVTLCLKCTNVEFHPYPFMGAVVMLFDRQSNTEELARLKEFLKEK